MCVVTGETIAAAAAVAREIGRTEPDKDEEPRRKADKKRGMMVWYAIYSTLSDTGYRIILSGGCRIEIACDLGGADNFYFGNWIAWHSDFGKNIGFLETRQFLL